jgi:hypothetical protein
VDHLKERGGGLNTEEVPQRDEEPRPAHPLKHQKLQSGRKRWILLNQLVHGYTWNAADTRRRFSQDRCIPCSTTERLHLAQRRSLFEHANLLARAIAVRDLHPKPTRKNQEHVVANLPLFHQDGPRRKRELFQLVEQAVPQRPWKVLKHLYFGKTLA